jgi:hypothetical protein
VLYLKLIPKHWTWLQKPKLSFIGTWTGFTFLLVQTSQKTVRAKSRESKNYPILGIMFKNSLINQTFYYVFDTASSFGSQSQSLQRIWTGFATQGAVLHVHDSQVPLKEARGTHHVKTRK